MPHRYVRSRQFRSKLLEGEKVLFFNNSIGSEKSDEVVGAECEAEHPVAPSQVERLDEALQNNMIQRWRPEERALFS